MMEHEHEPVGVFKDLPDDRDHSAENIYLAIGVSKGEYPPTLDLRDKMPAIRSQGSRNTCAAFTAAAIKEWQERTDSGFNGYMSPEFIYFYRPNKPDQGMFSRDVMDILLKKGCCSEDALIYSASDSGAPTEIPQKLIDDALGFKIKEYARIDTLEGLKTALYQNGPLYISFPVYDVRPQFWRKSADDVALEGGHAVVVVGYTSEGFIIRNSWGVNFGDRGYVIYPYSDFGAHWDIWTTIDSRGSPKPYAPPAKCCQIS